MFIHHFYDIMKIEDFDFLLDEKSYKNILIHDVSNTTLVGAKLLHIMFDKVNGFIRDYDRLALKNIMSFSIGSDTLQY